MQPINGTYPKVRQLSEEQYLVILNNGKYIYNHNYTNFSLIKNFENKQIINNNENNQKTTISEYKDNDNYYILCLLNNYL